MIRLQELELVFGHMHARMKGWTHRRDVGNSILDVKVDMTFGLKIIYDFVLRGSSNIMCGSFKGQNFVTLL